MARCPFCKHILPDKWVRKQGAALMGKTGGEAKARNNARAAALARWARAKEKKDKKTA
jgi:hypothetical protein